MKEKLIELLLEVDTICAVGECEGCIDYGVCFVHRAVDNIIENGVTVRANGEWKKTGNRHWDGSELTRCSVCGCITKGNYMSFCPSCGADMRGDL